MMVIQIDAYKRSHSAVVADEMGRERAVKTVGTTAEEHLKLLPWGDSHTADRLWEIGDLPTLVTPPGTRTRDESTEMHPTA